MRGHFSLSLTAALKHFSKALTGGDQGGDTHALPGAYA
jgi:hypothetical protein